MIIYEGEHLLPGQLGHFAAVTGFVASLVAAIAYFISTRKRDTEQAQSWTRLGKFSFAYHGIAVFSIIGIIFYMMLNRYYEYQYVWAHVSDDLPFRYIFSAFWEGQEGSFLLWMFWHVVLGYILMFKAGKWEAPVMAVVALVQAFLASMILGIYFGPDWKMGSSPFLLLRDTMDAPIFAAADYVSRIKGTGLNPLLQNYWMTIHPPTLFLGFASTIVPFAYAIAGLWTKQHKAWLQPALSWSLFSAGILGTGILMGGAWAYEALSFGGYWAWDPVENMSLVPWMVLLAGLHTHLVARATGHSIRSTYFFYITTFLLIAYSTFLTRSGVLGDTSVHAFTEMGLEAQLIAFISVFAILALGLFFARYKFVPAPAKEESTGSKEFWMFIGSLVMLFGACLITASTSLPVYNKIRQIFDPAYLGQVINDPIAHYNKYQLWIAVFMATFSGASQYLRFREMKFSRTRNKFLLHIGVATVISALLTWLMTMWINAKAWQYIALLFAGIFTVVTNLDYVINFLKGNLKMAGSAISHIGFGLMIVGVLASGLNKRFISTNSFAQMGLIEGFAVEDYQRNIMLMKGLPMFMNDYEVTYSGDTLVNHTRSFNVNYKRRNEAGKVVEEFNLSPNVLFDNSFTKIAASNPSTKHYLGKDIFTHVTALPPSEMDPQAARAEEDSLKYLPYLLAISDTIHSKENGWIVKLDRIDRNPVHPDYTPEEGDVPFGMILSANNPKKDTTVFLNPIIVLRQSLVFQYPDKNNTLNIKAKIPESVFDVLFEKDDDLPYHQYEVKQGERFSHNGYEVLFESFDVTATHPDYKRQEGDIAVGARMSINGEGMNNSLATPMLLIRENRPFNLKVKSGPLHFRFTKLDPESETATIHVAYSEKATTFPVEIAENVPLTDWIVLEAIVFPGINFFWLGTIMMMLGLFMAMIVRRRKQRLGVNKDTQYEAPEVSTIQRENITA